MIHKRHFFSSVFFDRFLIFRKLSYSAMRTSDITILHPDRIDHLFKICWNRQSFHISFISKVV
nr:MAG TPA: hypothetical protein [Bacteriophage sp.]